MVLRLQIRKSCVSALLIGVGVLLPQLFHFIGGSAAGRIFLPMHLPVFIAGFLLGPVYGVLTGLITPCISFLITGMPGQVALPFMLIELIAYGLMSGFIVTKTENLYLGLAISQVAGRIANGAAMLIAFYCLGISITPVGAFMTSLLLGVPGLILQYVCIPGIIPRLRRGMASC